MFSCLYDLASAFDTVEFCVLLEELFHAGLRGSAGDSYGNGITTL